MSAFVIWCVLAAGFAGLGIFCFFSRKQVGFWANAKPFPVSDVRGYNRACGRLWMGFSLVFALLGTPLVRQNDAAVLLSVVGAMASVIALILVYVLVIEKKFRQK